MKHVALALLTYVIAVLQTSQAMPLTPIDPMTCLAACVLVSFAYCPAIVWLMVFGLVNDLTGTGPIGMTAVSLIAAGFLTRLIVSHANERPLHVMATATLAFIVLAHLPRMLQAEGSLDRVLEFALAMLCTWFAAVTILLAKHVVHWLANRLRQQSASGGAVGTPVGLQVR